MVKDAKLQERQEQCESYTHAQKMRAQAQEASRAEMRSTTTMATIRAGESRVARKLLTPLGVAEQLTSDALVRVAERKRALKVWRRPPPQLPPRA